MVSTPDVVYNHGPVYYSIRQGRRSTLFRYEILFIRRRYAKRLPLSIRLVPGQCRRFGLHSRRPGIRAFWVPFFYLPCLTMHQCVLVCKQRSYALATCRFHRNYCCVWRSWWYLRNDGVQTEGLPQVRSRIMGDNWMPGKIASSF
jgi:hypothetical protein